MVGLGDFCNANPSSGEQPLEIPPLKIGFYELILRQLCDDGFDEASNMLSNACGIKKNEYVKENFLFSLYENVFFLSNQRKIFQNDGDGNAANLRQIGDVLCDLKVEGKWTSIKVKTRRKESCNVHMLNFDEKGDFLVTRHRKRRTMMKAEHEEERSCNEVNIYDISVAKGVTRIDFGFKSSCISVSASNDFHYIAGGGEDSTLKVMEVRVPHISSQEDKNHIYSSHDHKFTNKDNGTELINNISIFEVHSAPVTCISFHPWKPYCFSGSLDNTVKVSDFRTRRLTASAAGYIQEMYSISSLCVHPCGDFLYVGTTSPIIRCYDLQTLNCYTALDISSHHRSTINDIQCSGDGSIFVTAANDGNIQFWDTVNCKLINRIKGAHSGLPVTSVRMSRGGRYVLSAGCDGQCRIWDLRKGSQVIVMGNGMRQVDHAISELLTDERYVAYTCISDFNSRDGDIQIFNSYTGSWITTLQGIHTKHIRSMGSGASELSLITGCDDTKCRIVDLTFQTTQMIEEELNITEYT